MTIQIFFNNNKFDYYKGVTNINFTDNKIFIYVSDKNDTIIFDMQNIKSFKIKQ